MPENEVVVKTDKESVGLLCNSLNAWEHPMRYKGHHALADHLREAQRLIWTLYHENQALRGEKE